MKSLILMFRERWWPALWKALPGVLVWWWCLGYLLDGLNWNGGVLLAALLAGSLAAGLLSAWWLGRLDRVNLLRLLHSAPRATLLLALGIFAGLAVLGFLFPKPVFVATHTLTICAPEAGVYDRLNSPFVIYRVVREDGAHASLTDMKGEDPWNLENTALVAQGAGACATYRDFFKGGVAVFLREGPGAGTARVEWDGRVHTVDLNSAQEDLRRINLPGDHPPEASWLRRAASVGMNFSQVATAAGLALLLALALRRGSWGGGALERDNLWLLAGLLAVVGLLAAGQLGRSAALAADDFCYAGAAGQMGLWGGTLEFYTSVNGRLLGNFMGILSGILFPYQPLQHAVFLVLGLWIAAVSPVLGGMLYWLSGQKRTGLAVLLSALVVLVTWMNAPNINQSLYWRAGREPLVFPLILFSLLASLVLVAARTKSAARRGLALLGLALGALLAGAFHEAYAAAQLAMAGLGLLLAWAYGRWAGQAPIRLLAALGAALPGALAGMLVHALAPGTAERSSALGTTFDPGRVLYGALYEGNAFMFAHNLNILTLGLFILGLALAVRSARPKQLPAARQTAALWLGLPLVLWAGLVAAFAVGYYGLGGILPPRTQIIPTYFGVLSAPLLGMLSGAELLRHAPKLASGRWLRTAQGLAVIALGVASLFHAHAAMSQKPFFDRYAAAVAGMVRSVQKAEAAGLAGVNLNRLPDNPYGVTNPGTHEANFVNGCVNRLFGIRLGFR